MRCTLAALLAASAVDAYAPTLQGVRAPRRAVSPLMSAEVDAAAQVAASLPTGMLLAKKDIVVEAIEEFAINLPVVLPLTLIAQALIGRAVVRGGVRSRTQMPRRLPRQEAQVRGGVRSRSESRTQMPRRLPRQEV